jgi:predicted  nucleic acid-binding Zn-ribbon protein
LEQYSELIALAGLFIGSIIAGVITALMRTSALSANQKTNQSNITELQKKLEKTTLAAARLYGRLEAYTDQIKRLEELLKKVDGEKNDIARLLITERTARQEDKKKYESEIAALNSRVTTLEVERDTLKTELALERRKSQGIPTPALGVAL